jgi:hypothetical protein
MWTLGTVHCITLPGEGKLSTPMKPEGREALAWFVAFISTIIDSLLWTAMEVPENDEGCVL